MPSDGVRAVPQAAFMALSFGILLFALYFIGSVVVESALPTSKDGTNNGNHQTIGFGGGRANIIQSLESIEGSNIRGRPAGGSALDASLKKRLERNEKLIGRIKADQNRTAQNDGQLIPVGSEDIGDDEEETHFADRIRGSAISFATSQVYEEDEPVVEQSGKSINYHLQPDLFTSAISNCLLDEQCRIIYHHVGKSGGTTIEDTFFRMYPPELKSCCGGKILGKLANDDKAREKYCTAKFSSYQILGKYVKGLTKSCTRIITNATEDDQHDPGQRPRSIILTTYREPISRTLSSIHQLCNKQSEKRKNETLEACTECRYDFGTDVWDHVINMTNDHYEGVAEVAALQIPDVQVISLDMIDISPALDRLRERLKADADRMDRDGIPEVPMTRWRNPELKSVCSFAMTSDMIKSLGTAQAVYRSLTSGFL